MIQLHDRSIEHEHEHEHEKQPEQNHAPKWPVGRAQFERLFWRPLGDGWRYPTDLLLTDRIDTLEC
jgi:hypothetical protein